MTPCTVYNLMESQALIENEWTSYYPVNAHNSGSVIFFSIFTTRCRGDNSF